jgi:hypothetical protein
MILARSRFWLVAGLLLAAAATIWGLPGLTPDEARALRAGRVPMALANQDTVAGATAESAAPGPVVASAPAPVVSGDYAAWAARHFSPAELADAETSAPDAIYGADGLTNLLKYALGLDPKQDASAARPQTDEIDGHWLLSFAAPANRADVTFLPEVSVDGSNWTATGVTLEPVSESGGRIVWQAHYQASGEEPVEFRLGVALTPDGR